MMYWTVATSLPPIEGGREYDQFRDNFSEPLLLAWFNEEGKVSKTFQYGYYDHKIRQYRGLEDHREFHPTHWMYQKDFLEDMQAAPKFNPENVSLPFKKSGLLTERLIVDIEDLIVGPTRNCRETLFVPNVSWGFFREHEADLVQISRSGFMTEYEIKRSWSDFLADFKKKSYHADDRISELYYVVPEVMAQQAADHICPDEKSRWSYHAGVLGFDEGLCRLKTYLACSYPKGKKLYLEDQYEIARLGVLRYWAMRRSL